MLFKSGTSVIIGNIAAHSLIRLLAYAKTSIVRWAFLRFALHRSEWTMRVNFVGFFLFELKWLELITVCVLLMPMV